MSKQYDVAVVGATGAVGETMMSILEERDFPVRTLYPLASARSAGKTVKFRGKSVRVTDLAEFDFSQAQIGLFSAGGSISEEFAPKAAAAGCIVIDNTSHFRRDADIPLIVPEVNLPALAGYTQRNIIANPNCSTIQMLVALKPIYDAVGIERINVCTYQAVSGTGKEAIEELAGQTARLLNGQSIECEVYPKQIAFNVLPHIETRDKISAADARKLLEGSPGITVVDERADGGYPTAVTESAGKDPVFVGRIREDISHPRGLDLWVVSDNVRKGAALNSVQIAEALIRGYID